MHKKLFYSILCLFLAWGCSPAQDTKKNQSIGEAEVTSNLHALSNSCEGGLFYGTIESVDKVFNYEIKNAPSPNFVSKLKTNTPLVELNPNNKQYFSTFFSNLNNVYNQSCSQDSHILTNKISTLGQQSFRILSDKDYLSENLHKYISLASDETSSFISAETEKNITDYIQSLSPVTIETFLSLLKTSGVQLFEQKVADAIEINENNIHHVIFLGSIKAEISIQRNDIENYRDGMKVLFNAKKYIRSSLQNPVQTHSTFHTLFADYTSLEVYLAIKLSEYSQYIPPASKDAGFWQAHYDTILGSNPRHENMRSGPQLTQHAMRLAVPYPSIEQNPALWTRYHKAKIQNARFFVQAQNAPLTCEAFKSVQILEFVYGPLDGYDDVRSWCQLPQSQ